MAEAALPNPGARALRIGIGVPVAIVALLSMLVLPLPPFILDVLFTFNIAFSMVVLLVGVYNQRTLDFAVFPTVLLVATLLRLALNVASTRVILLEGHAGGDAAGKVIEAFGDFVVGGNYAVGIIVFIILVIINFVVITKGAGRVSEVSARFILDAMPGKQMAIDADLNSGLITQEEARTRRTEVAREAEFFGAMDGASKFVRGDAIAGILIVFVNIIGGLIVGTVQHDMAMGEAAQVYTLLTIGDGLVAQIPGLVLSTAAAIMVTRVSDAGDVGAQINAQMGRTARPMYVAASVLGVVGIVPGMPNLAFLSLAAGVAGLGWLIDSRNRALEAIPEPVAKEPVAPEARELGWDDVQPVDLIGLEVGYRLIPLVDRNQGGPLMNRIKGVRKKLTQELGFLIHSVHIRDNLDLAPNAYRITLMGVTAGEAEVYAERELAINPGKVFGTIPGIATRDPAFGLEAVWIEKGQKEQAQALGYTVVDASTVVATHLSQLLQNNAHQLLGHEEVQQMLDLLARSSPKLVEDLVPKTLPRGVVLKVLQNLLAEGVPVRDFRTIAETLAEHGARTQDPDTLTGAVRASLGRLIVQQINGVAPELPVITLDPGVEQILHQSLQGNGGGAGLEPGFADVLHKGLGDMAQKQEAAGQPVVLLVPSALRNWLARFARHAVSGMHVLAYNEIPNDKRIKVVGSVGQPAMGRR